jgi:hypothetical protein
LFDLCNDICQEFRRKEYYERKISTPPDKGFNLWKSDKIHVVSRQFERSATEFCYGEFNYITLKFLGTNGKVDSVVGG